MDTKQVIGFANQYYTLWDVGSEKAYDSMGRFIGTRWIYAFRKNISKDIDKVKSLYPDTEIDKDLHGHRSFSYIERKPQEEKPQDIFPFGKYAGQKIADCKDISYLAWAYNNAFNIHQQKYAEEPLKKAGYMIKDGRAYDAKEQQTLFQQAAFSSLLDNKLPFDVEFTKNLDMDGNYWFNGKTLHFEHYREMEYNGYPYALPVINGKGIRIKGKKFRITDYYPNPERESEIIVTGFAPVK